MCKKPATLVVCPQTIDLLLMSYFDWLYYRNAAGKHYSGKHEMFDFFLERNSSGKKTF